jgi:hypothetical protein
MVSARVEIGTTAAAAPSVTSVTVTFAAAPATRYAQDPGIGCSWSQHSKGNDCFRCYVRTGVPPSVLVREELDRLLAGGVDEERTSSPP